MKLNVDGVTFAVESAVAARQRFLDAQQAVLDSAEVVGNTKIAEASNYEAVYWLRAAAEHLWGEALWKKPHWDFSTERPAGVWYLAGLKHVRNMAIHRLMKLQTPTPQGVGFPLYISGDDQPGRPVITAEAYHYVDVDATGHNARMYQKYVAGRQVETVLTGAAQAIVDELKQQLSDARANDS